MAEGWLWVSTLKQRVRRVEGDEAGVVDEGRQHPGAVDALGGCGDVGPQQARDLLLWLARLAVADERLEGAMGAVLRPGLGKRLGSASVGSRSCSAKWSRMARRSSSGSDSSRSRLSASRAGSDRPRRRIVSTVASGSAGGTKAASQRSSDGGWSAGWARAISTNGLASARAARATCSAVNEPAST